jgi:hypothetical protein
MASVLKVDALQGIASAGAITVTSEGGTATQSLQQGLCKAWLQGNSDASTDDDFNIASGTDNGTGDYTYSFTANMNNNTHIATGMSSDNNAEIIHSNSRSTTSVIIRVKEGSDGATARDRPQAVAVHGDLA